MGTVDLVKKNTSEPLLTQTRAPRSWWHMEHFFSLWTNCAIHLPSCHHSRIRIPTIDGCNVYLRSRSHSLSHRHSNVNFGFLDILKKTETATKTHQSHCLVWWRIRFYSFLLHSVWKSEPVSSRTARINYCLFILLFFLNFQMKHIFLLSRPTASTCSNIYLNGEKKNNGSRSMVIQIIFLFFSFIFVSTLSSWTRAVFHNSLFSHIFFPFFFLFRMRAWEWFECRHPWVESS